MRLPSLAMPNETPQGDPRSRLPQMSFAVDGKPDTFGSLKSEIVKEYPAIGNIPFDIEHGSGRGYAETYPSWERDNPRQGKNLIQLREQGQKLKGKALKEMIAGETLHFLAGTDDQGNPNDLVWSGMKQAFKRSLTPEQLAVDKRAYQRGVKEGHENRSFDQWMDATRADAYIRAYLFPNETNKEWQEPGVYTDSQKVILENARNYLKGKKS